MRVAIIDNETNKVENVEIHNSLPVIEGKTCIHSDTAGINDDYDGVDFIKPIIPPKPLIEIWEDEMLATDSLMSRLLEDVIDTMSSTQLGKLALPTKEKYDAKKAKRQEGIDNSYI